MVKERRGAALLIAIVILAFLMAIAISFYSSTRMQIRNALNTQNAMSASLAAEAGTAFAVAFLRHDAEIHRTYTSLDHAWRTYFNGAWIADKAWAFPNGGGSTWARDTVNVRFDPDSPPVVPGGDPIPTIYMDDVDVPGFGDLVYSPRQQAAIPSAPYDPNDWVGEFVINQDYEPVHGVLPAKQVDLWCDVDSDGDGLKDAMWIPIPRDVSFTDDGLDNDLDGLIDEGPGWGRDGIDNDGDNAACETDGIDNDGNNAAWQTDGIDNDGDGAVDEVNEGIDEPGEGIDESDENYEPERALFVYFGGDDGLDNDGDGSVDEADENKLFLTTPFVNNNGAVINAPITVLNDGRYAPVSMVVNSAVAADVDVLDNDYDFIINDRAAYSFTALRDPELALVLPPVDPVPALEQYVEPMAQWPIKYWQDGTFYTEGDLTPFMDRLRNAYHQVHEGYAAALGYQADPSAVNYTFYTAMGEPVCEVVGRVAVLINDEASKANLNAVHAHKFQEFRDTTQDEDYVRRVIANGVGPQEYDLRVMPGLGVTLPNRIIGLRYGGDKGVGFVSWNDGGNTPRLLPADGPYAYDTSLPGYGMVDDDGTAFWLAMTRVDEDGNGWPYDGIRPFDYTGSGAQLAWLEGVDDPYEYRPFRPYRNRIAETDATNNSLPAITPSGSDPPPPNEGTDEIGEWGDRYYRTRDQLRGIYYMPDSTVDELRPLVTAFSFDRNDRYDFTEDDGSMAAQPSKSGLKLDFNYALADQITEMLISDWPYPPQINLDTLVEEDRFALGLLREDVSVMGEMAILGGTVGAGAVFGPDDRLRAYQLGVTVEDYRDPAHYRTEAALEIADTWWNDTLGGADERDISYTVAGVESIRINEIMVRAVRRVEAEVTVDTLGADYSTMLDPNAFSVPDPDSTPDELGPAFGASDTADFLVARATFGTRVGTNTFGNVPAAGTATTPTGDPVLWDPSSDDWQLDDGDDSTALEFLGSRAVWTTNEDSENQIHISSTDIPQGWESVQPYNIIQFVFAPSPGLPPGRYYLTVNTADADGNPTVTEATHLEYAIKYITLPGSATTATASGKEVGTHDILYDEFNRVFNGTEEVPWQSLANDYIGTGAAEGWVFLPTRLYRNPTGEDATAIPPNVADPAINTNSSELGYEQDEAFTVEIPAYTGDPTTQVYLCVALRKGDSSNRTRPLAINFFDFSQEPDHEWIELVNIAEEDPYLSAEAQSICVDGWDIEIGLPGGDDRTILSLPEPGPGEPPQTLIPPGGSILVGINKFDNFDINNPWNHLQAAVPGNPMPVMNLIKENGIGLVGGMAVQSTPAAPEPFAGAPDEYAGDATYGAPYDYFYHVTAPPIPNPMYYETDVHGNGLGVTPVLPSVFHPYLPATGANHNDFVDYLDANGDTLEDPVDWDTSNPPDGTDDARVADLVRSSYDAEIEDYAGGWNTINNKPWDRIVEAEVIFPGGLGALSSLTSSLTTGGVHAAGEADEGVARLARIVLRGGIFPNYPEHDGIDNDRDNLYLVDDGIDNNGNNAPWEVDGVNNDGDVFTDEAGEGIDEPNEGIDEGNWRWTAVPPVAPIPPAALAAPVPTSGSYVPGGYNIHSFTYATSADVFEPGDPTSGSYPDPDPDVYPTYLGTYLDSPHWKAYTERAFFPGDCVFVTLYQGRAQDGLIADRVTYTERDVVNRSIDDVVECPYVADFDGDGDTTTDIDFNGTDDTPERMTLDPRYPTMWLDNTMAVDFYRSLPRKHPLYMGDRFGTRNRWEASDGNYDDWDNSANLWSYEAPNDPDNHGTPDNVPDRHPHWLDSSQSEDAKFRYGHCFNGSPLRMNMFQRQSEERFDQFQDVDLNPAVDANPLNTPLGWVESWKYKKAGVRNAKLESAADFMRMPQFTMTMALINSSARVYEAMGQMPSGLPSRDATEGIFDFLLANPATSGLGELGTVTGSALVGQDDTRDLTALISGTTSDSVMLTCAQADFYPLYPTPAEVMATPGLVQWDLDAGDFPQAWVPIFLYSLDSAGEEVPHAVIVNDFNALFPPVFSRFGEANYRVEMNFLLSTPSAIPAGLSTASLRNRWPIGSRAVMYVSANPKDFETPVDRSTLPGLDAVHRPSEALFVWDVDDGLENGEYDVYVVTCDSLDVLGIGADEEPTLFEQAPDTGQAAGDPTLGEQLLAAAGEAIPGTMGVDINFFTDRDGDRECWTDSNGNGYPDIEPTVAADELNILTESFGMFTGAAPNAEGLIHYGIVTVENNYLALRIRNWALPQYLNRFSRVILAPREKTFGRMNVNTVETRDVDGTDVNALSGIPGILAGFDTVAFTGSQISNWEDAGDFDAANNRLVRARAVMATRQDWGDGRYFVMPSDLITLEPPLRDGGPELYPSVLTDSSIQGEEAGFEEILYRFGRMANLITTRSDVYEIIVTGQSGYISNEDVNGDGKLDWREDFVTTGEKRFRTVYER